MADEGENSSKPYGKHECLFPREVIWRYSKQQYFIQNSGFVIYWRPAICDYANYSIYEAAFEKS